MYSRINFFKLIKIIKPFIKKKTLISKYLIGENDSLPKLIKQIESENMR